MRTPKRFSILIVFSLITGSPCLAQELRPLPGFPVSTSVSPDGSLLAVARVAQSGGDIEVWTLPQLKLKRRWSWQNDATIRCVALSADGRFVAAGGSAVGHRKPAEARVEQEQKGQIIVWEIDSGAVVYTIDSGMQVESLAFSPDQPLLVSGGAYLHVYTNFNATDTATGFEIHLWDARTGAHIKKAVESEVCVGLGQFQLSADGNTLLAAFSGSTWRSSQYRRYRMAFELVLYDLKTGKTRRRLILVTHHGNFLIGFGKNWIATLEDDSDWFSDPSVRPLRIGLWDTNSLKRKREYLAPHADIFDARPSADGNSLVLMKNESVDWLDPQTLKVTRNAPAMHPPGSVRVLSPDGGSVLCLSIETIRIQDLTTGRVHAAETGYKGGTLFEPSLDSSLLLSLSGITSVSFSPDGRTIAAGSDHGELFAWDLKSAQLLLDIEAHGGPIRQLAFVDASGRLLTAADDGSVNTWSLESVELLSGSRVSSARTSVLALSRDSSYVSAGGPGFGIRELDVATGNIREVLTESNLTFTSLCYSPVDHLLAWGRPDGTVDLLDLSAGAERRRLRQAGLPAIKCLAFSPDGTRLVTGAEDGGIEIRDVKTGKIVKELDAHKGSVTALSFSSQGLLASGGEDRTLNLWRSGKREASLKGHESSIHALAFSTDGQFVAAATGNRSLCVWSVSNEKLFTVLRPPVRH